MTTEASARHREDAVPSLRPDGSRWDPLALVPVRHNGMEAPHEPKPSADAPKRFGFYRVYRVEAGQPFDRYPNALMLDYGLGGNPALDPSRLLRDYLVQVYPDDPTLLLGHAFLAVPGKPGLSFFVLRRERQHRYRG